jgi:hypothetical protein
MTTASAPCWAAKAGAVWMDAHLHAGHLAGFPGVQNQRQVVGCRAIGAK